jgi:hypothetical protein
MCRNRFDRSVEPRIRLFHGSAQFRLSQRRRRRHGTTSEFMYMTCLRTRGTLQRMTLRKPGHPVFTLYQENYILGRSSVMLAEIHGLALHADAMMNSLTEDRTGLLAIWQHLIQYFDALTSLKPLWRRTPCGRKVVATLVELDIQRSLFRLRFCAGCQNFAYSMQEIF